MHFMPVRTPSFAQGLVWLLGEAAIRRRLHEACLEAADAIKIRLDPREIGAILIGRLGRGTPG